MYCYKCGKLINDDSAFCRYCGASQKTDMMSVQSNPISHTHTDSGELDRSALKTHLFNILSLEYMKNKLSNEYYFACNQLSKVPKNENIYTKICVRNSYRSRYAHFMYDGKKHYLAFSPDKVHAFVQESLNKQQFNWVAINSDNRSILYDEKTWKHIGSDYDGFFERGGYIKEGRDIAFREFLNFEKQSVKDYPGYAASVRSNRAKWANKCTRLKPELDQVTALLKRTYAINIIPEPYRGDIFAIYYLHSFISTSAESFSSALLHLDLEQIKIQLGTIISQQETIIIQQARQISQNQQIIDQNKRQLMHLADISNNTARAAEYSSIAATNSEICAWFAAAQYFNSK